MGYCGKACFNAHWPEHKLSHKQLRAQGGAGGGDITGEAPQENEVQGAAAVLYLALYMDSGEGLRDLVDQFVKATQNVFKGRAKLKSVGVDILCNGAQWDDGAGDAMVERFIDLVQVHILDNARITRRNLLEGVRLQCVACVTWGHYMMEPNPRDEDRYRQVRHLLLGSNDAVAVDPRHTRVYIADSPTRDWASKARAAGFITLEERLVYPASLVATFQEEMGRGVADTAKSAGPSVVTASKIPVIGVSVECEDEEQAAVMQDTRSGGGSVGGGGSDANLTIGNKDDGLAAMTTEEDGEEKTDKSQSKTTLIQVADEALSGRARRSCLVYDCRPQYSCDACNEPDATQRCSKCRSVYYCDKRCQAVGWKKGGHRKACRVDTKDLPPRELFLSSWGFDGIKTGYSGETLEKIMVMTRGGQLRPAQSIYEFVQQLVVEQGALLIALEKAGFDAADLSNVLFGPDLETIQIARADGWKVPLSESWNGFMPALEILSFRHGRMASIIAERRQSEQESRVALVVAHYKGLDRELVQMVLCPFIVGRASTTFPCKKVDILGLLSNPAEDSSEFRRCRVHTLASTRGSDGRLHQVK